MINYNKIKKVCLFSVILATLTSCSDSHDDLNRYIFDVKKRKGAPVEPIPEFKVPDQFSYPEHLKRRSPFTPMREEQKEKVDVNAPDQSRPKQPLENFALDSLKFVGTLDDSQARWGLIQAPNGRIFRVKVGDFMGKNYGRIIQLTDETLKLEETIKIVGKWEKKIITLKLK
ncbi:pilus assembly protein PilP [Legionella sp. W05-934-2]|jgi:type IV pilus assembly protein PilP|uniref:pilus assembly protein PilP n=1 Tax=Legionella sp. W05-934-2 TaxID=1198649 RepID=UPI0034622DE3